MKVNSPFPFFFYHEYQIMNTVEAFKDFIPSEVQDNHIHLDSQYLQAELIRLSSLSLWQTKTITQCVRITLR